MPEHILPLPPRWERDVECGWVVFRSGPDEIRGYFAKPKGGRNLPGIIMVHENLGIIENRQDVTRRLAHEGYAALTVDLYSRNGGQSPRDFKTPEERRLKASRITLDEETIPDLEAGAAYLAALPEVDPARIGAIGYCSGGGTLYGWVSGHSTNLKAAVVFYGAADFAGDARPDGKPVDRTRTAHLLQIPIQVHHGDADRAVKLADATRMVEALKTSQQPVEFHVYPGADHAFHDDTHPQYHDAAAKQAWRRAMEFLAGYLHPAPR